MGFTSKRLLPSISQHTLMQTGLVTSMIAPPPPPISASWDTIPFPGVQKKQRAVTHSSTEAEYRSLANAALETMWLLSLLSELGFPLKTPPSLLCDNLGATHLSFNPVHHSRMKHIQIDLHFVRDLVQQGSLHVKHVHTQNQLANLLTKLLSRQRIVFLRFKIGRTDGTPILRGRIKETCINSAKIKQQILTKA